MTRTLLCIARRIFASILLASAVSPASADFVTPSDRVTSGVIIRTRPNGNSASLGLLQPGERLELVDSVPNWNRVRLADGRFGFVNKSWTQIVEDGGPSPPGPGATGGTGDFTIHVVDVGTGLALIVKGADFTLIFDGGSNDDTARGDKNRLLAYMRAVLPEIREIDHLILSHPHRDHVELLPDILENYDVKNVWDSGAVNDICGYRLFIMGVSAESVVTYRSARNDSGTHPVRFSAKTCYGQAFPQANILLAHGPQISRDPIALGEGAEMTFLHADGGDYGNAYNKNSLVVRLDLGGKRVLLMGDAEAGGRALPSTMPQPDSIEGVLLICCMAELRADVMVVGHHGSMTSSRRAFLDAIGAAVFVVSAGPTRYATVVLPDQAVINELTQRGRVFRTDLNDSSCLTQQAKIGPDNDGNAGGCDNIRISITGSGIQSNYWRGAD